MPLLLEVLRTPDKLAALSLSEWDVLIRQARQANLLGTIDALAEGHGLSAKLPAAPARHLAWARALAEKQVSAVRHEVSRIQEALEETGTPVALLKGAAYVMAGLPAAAGRFFSDVDILVPKDRLNLVEAALMLHGWATTHHDPYDQRYYRQWMHELPPMQHVRRLTVIDVHHAILPETAAAHPDTQKLLAASIPVNGDAKLRTLQPVDIVLHSATHLFYEGEMENALRNLLDIHLLLKHFGAQPSFWTTLVPRAVELELSRPLFYALRYSRQLLNASIPEDVMRDSSVGAPSALLLPLMDRIFLRTLLPDHPTCADRASPLAKFALYLRGNWLRMPVHLLIPHLFHKAFLSPKKEG